ncbi:hypothetical protein [Pseudomonas sp. PDM31]|jgi:hypothetical protein|uniref:hypothetical protein n=1 Tax=Pseudomonas sp. PDM31 TaxID=2854778 RepID=UPI001C43CB4C|nr:hypothetical protein [Pseudomonas sp. PDM31]MBV7478185.1 hypothetical protein [Pseudomonas sp. PDM31]
MKNIDFSQMVTAEQQLEERKNAELQAALSARRAAYLAESDPLRLEADYDALSQGLEPDYTNWLASVAAIKARYPLPANAEASGINDA